MAMHLGGKLRCYANKLSLPAKALCAERFPVGARSYFSGSVTTDTVTLYGEICAAGAVVGWLWYRFDWFGHRTEYESLIADSQRRKFDHVKADLKEIERKVDIIKAEQYERANKDNLQK